MYKTGCVGIIRPESRICPFKKAATLKAKGSPTDLDIAVSRLFTPSNSKVEVFCTHSAGSGSHSWTNTYYALDLATSHEKPASVIRASADGKAFVFFR